MFFYLSMKTSVHVPQLCRFRYVHVYTGNNKIDIEKNLMNNSLKLSNLNLYMYFKCLKSNLKSTYGTYPVVELWSPE